jgi:hypothetical protein
MGRIDGVAVSRDVVVGGMTVVGAGAPVADGVVLPVATPVAGPVAGVPLADEAPLDDTADDVDAALDVLPDPAMTAAGAWRLWCCERERENSWALTVASRVKRAAVEVENFIVGEIYCGSRVKVKTAGDGEPCAEGERGEEARATGEGRRRKQHRAQPRSKKDSQQASHVAHVGMPAAKPLIGDCFGKNPVLPGTPELFKLYIRRDSKTAR